MLKNILFVDEEQRFLNAIKRRLRSMRDEWMVHLASDPDEALQIVSTTKVDVLVTGMMFSGRSGLDLLAEIRDKHPGIVRMILSGHTDTDLIFKSVDLAHQFIAKPCDDKDLRAAIQRAFMIKDLLDSEPLRQAITHISSLPSLPSLYVELVEALESEDASVQKIGDLIAKDLGLTTKILKLVNSSFFGRRQSIADPVKAVAFLGIDLVKAIVLMSGMLDSFRNLAFKDFYLEVLWEHSVRTAAMAKNIAKDAGLDQEAVDHAFAGGLLHDIGKLLIVAHMPDKFASVLQLMDDQSISMAEAEAIVLGTTHAAIGGYLLGLWGLPCPIVEAAAFHHAPIRANGQSLSPQIMVFMANAFANACGYLNDGNRVIDGVDYEYLDKAHLLDHLARWREVCADCCDSHPDQTA